MAALMKGYSRIRKIRSMTIILIIVVSGLAALLSLSPQIANAYTTHDPIVIDGDADFANQATNEGWPGDGSAEDPFIISDYEIDASSNNGISISSTNKHFIVKDSFIKDGADKYSGIVLREVMNGTISNCIINNNRHGIGIYNSDIIKVINNTFANNTVAGIFLDLSNLNTIVNNTMIGNGIFINHGYHIHYWNSHNIDSSNTVNGKPVIYWKNQTGGVVPSGAGQVILANCTDIHIENQEITNASVGIQIGHSSNISIKNNIVSNMQIGIHLVRSSENTVINNLASNNDYSGVFLELHSEYNTLENNRGSDNKHGIFINSDENTLSYNNFSGSNEKAFYFTGSDNNIVTNNTALNNICGFQFHYSDLNIMNNNTISLNYNGIIILDSIKNNVFNNIIFNNNFHGISLIDSIGNKIKSNNIFRNENGIGFYDASENDIIDNIILKNNIGISIYSDGNNITGNNISLNNNYGISLVRCSWNNITNNVISLNKEYGIFINTSNNNSFHHNNIFDNTNQLFRYESSNIWDNGNGEGNYWSDYNGKDENGDGVGDTDLPHQGVDYYPLMSPVGTEDVKGTDPMILIICCIVSVIIILILPTLALISFIRQKKAEKTKLKEEGEGTQRRQNQG